jgi:hypothetical protein
MVEVLALEEAAEGVSEVELVWEVEWEGTFCSFSRKCPSRRFSQHPSPRSCKASRLFRYPISARWRRNRRRDLCCKWQRRPRSTPFHRRSLQVLVRLGLYHSPVASHQGNRKSRSPSCTHSQRHSSHRIRRMERPRRPKVAI